LYNIAVAAFCERLAASPLRSGNKTRCAYSAPQQSKRYLIIIDGKRSGRLRGGLHDQLMALQSHIELADALNRTLVLPLMTSSFPGMERTVRLMDISELYAVGKIVHPKRSSEQWFASLHDVHGSAFLRRETVALPVYGRYGYDAAPLLHHGALLLVANRIGPMQPMHAGWLLSSTLKLDGNALRAYQEVLCQLCSAGSPQATHSISLRTTSRKAPHCCHASRQPYFLAMHMRIESDWLRYANANNCSFRAFYRSVQEIQEAFREWFVPPTDSSVVSLYLSFDETHLPKGMQVSKDVGWPAGVRVLTNSAFQSAFMGLSYLERSAVARELCLSAAHFIGNSHSSFTEAIVQARHGLLAPGVPARSSHVYNCLQPSNHLVECTGRRCACPGQPSPC